MKLTALIDLLQGWQSRYPEGIDPMVLMDAGGGAVYPRAVGVQEAYIDKGEVILVIG